MLESFRTRVKHAFAGDLKGDIKAVFTDWKGWRELPVKTKKAVIYTIAQKFMSDESKTPVEPAGLSRRDVLKIGGAAMLLAACGVKLTETPKPKDPDPEVYPGLLYQEKSAVFKIESGLGVRATLNGFEFVPKTKNLGELPFAGLKFSQGEPNGRRAVKNELSAILPGLDGGLVINDKDGIPISGLISVNQNLSILTRMETPNDNLLAMFALNLGEKKQDRDDGSYTLQRSADMTQRILNQSTGKTEWTTARIGGRKITINVIFEYDRRGNLISYSVPTLNVSLEPTKAPDQQAVVNVKDISFLPKGQAVVETSTPSPTASNTPLPSKTPYATETPESRPTKGQSTNAPQPTNEYKPSATPKPQNTQTKEMYPSELGGFLANDGYTKGFVNPAPGNAPFWMISDCRQVYNASDPKSSNWAGSKNLTNEVFYSMEKVTSWLNEHRLVGAKLAYVNRWNYKDNVAERGTVCVIGN